MVMRIATCIYIRSGSTRLPGKCYRLVCGKTMLEHIVYSLESYEDRNDIWLMTSTEKRDDKLVTLAKSLGISVFRGCERYPVQRTWEALSVLCREGYSHIARVCGDSPMYSVEVQSKIVEIIRKEGPQWSGGNTLPKSFPNGMSVEIYCIDALRKVLAEEPELLREDSLTEVMKRISLRLNVMTTEVTSDLGSFTVDTFSDVEKITDKMLNQRGEVASRIMQMIDNCVVT